MTALDHLLDVVRERDVRAVSQTQGARQAEDRIEPLVFSILANNYGPVPERAIETTIDAIIVQLASFRR